MKTFSMVVVLLLWIAFSAGLVSLGVAAESSRLPSPKLQQYEGQIKAVDIERCGLVPGECIGSIRLAQAGTGKEITLVIRPGTWLKRGDSLSYIEDFGVGNYVQSV